MPVPTAGRRLGARREEYEETVETAKDLKAPASCPGDPCAMVIFGAAGDLTKRLLVPSLYNLHASRLLPEHFAVVG
jgi:hypothetical protein